VSTELEDAVFDISSYDLPIPSIDGFKTSTLRLRFTGAGILIDRTDEIALGFLNALRMGQAVRLVVVGSVDTKQFRRQAREGDEAVEYGVTVKIEEIELGELA
jgi:hypothetical protein